MIGPICALLVPVAVEYRSSDGKPMAESDAQRAAIMYTIDALQTSYADRPMYTYRATC